MPTFDDLGKGVKLENNLKDEMKQNGMDLLLPYEDFNSGWIFLSRNATVVISHNLGFLPRLISIFGNVEASNINMKYVLSGTAAVEITAITETSLAIKNTSTSYQNKYFKVLIWR